MPIVSRRDALLRHLRPFARGSARAGVARAYLLGLVALGVVVISLIPSIQPLLQNGDSAVYNDQVDARQLGIRTTHIGYIALGMAFRALLPGNTDLIMNVMSLVVGGFGLFAVYCSALKLSESILGGVLAVAIVAAIPAYLRGMALSEVDVPLAALIAIAFALRLHARLVLSALVFGYAMLVSPLAALALPAFVIPFSTARDQRLRLRGEARRILIFGALSLLLYGSVVLLNWQDYVFGGRGILHAPRKAFDLATHVQRSLTFFRGECGLLLLPLGFGAAFALWRGLYGLVFGTLAVLALSLLLGERFIDVPVQLPTVLLAAPWVSLIVIPRWPWSRWVFGIAVSVIVVHWRASAMTALRQEIARLADERATYRAVADSSTLPVVLANVNGFEETNRLERIVFGRTHTGRALSRNEMRRRCARFAREDFAIWFVRPPLTPPCAPLGERYALSRRRVGERVLGVLLPRSAAH